MLDQVLAPLDPEYALAVGEYLKRHGVKLALGDGVAGFKALDAVPWRSAPGPARSIRRTS